MLVVPDVAGRATEVNGGADRVAMLMDTAMCDQWLDDTPEEALNLQVPAPDDWLTIVSRGPRKDES